jgi:TolA-binding protein
LPLAETFSQQTAIYDPFYEEYSKAKELFTHQKYSSAQEIFAGLLESDAPGLDVVRPEVVFYDALCAVELHHQDATSKINNYISSYPEHGLTNEAWYYLGKMHFNDNKFRDAQRSLQKVRPSRLSGVSRDEYYFMLGYSSLRNDDLTTAKNFFSRVSDRSPDLSGQAFYYIGHINYLEGRYEEALASLEKLENDRRYRKVIPEYKLQIYHQLGDYDIITASADKWLEDAGSTNKADAARIIGDAWYHKGDFEQAMKYMEIFERTARFSISREDHYLLGYTYYRNEEYGKSLANFQKAVTIDDSLSQAAYYYTGACYNMMGEKKYAANSFLSAYKMDIDQDISEEALFNYIRITLETGFNPYNEAVELLEQYLAENPGSERKDEAYSYLADLYLTSRNYRQALASIENVQYKSSALEEAYQKILYYRAIELFNANELEAAIGLFKKAAGYNYDETIRSEASFWIGECFYRQSNYWGCIKYTKDFLASPQAKRSENYGKAFYNLGYSHFNRKEYSDAIAQFKKYGEITSGRDTRLWNDAMLRIGDAYFVNSQYSSAISYYDKVIASQAPDADYALYQKALSFGAQGNYRGKTENLRDLISSYGGSRYRDDAIYEAALTYTIIEDNRNALIYFDKLIQGYPNSAYTATALLKKGFIYYNSNEYQPAIEAFKKAIAQFPSSKESQEALASLKNIYLDMNKMDEYYSFAKGLSFADISATEEDSLTYKAAENIYLQGDCQRAASAFRNYLEKFPQGGYVDPSRYYLAECLGKTGQQDLAMQEYEMLAQRPRSRFTEEVLVKLSGSLYASGQYEEALGYYRQLEQIAEYQQNLVTALLGQMRCEFRAGNNTRAIEAGKKLLATAKVPDEIAQEAHLTLARAYFDEDEIELARMEYSSLAQMVSNERAAEAYYYLALIDYETGRDAEAENRIFEMSEKLAAYDYWVAKGFILLADIYESNGNTFQARQTLQSIIDNYEGPELGEIARNKLKALQNNESSENE